MDDLEASLLTLSKALMNLGDDALRVQGKEMPCMGCGSQEPHTLSKTVGNIVCVSQ